MMLLLTATNVAKMQDDNIEQLAFYLKDRHWTLLSDQNENFIKENEWANEEFKCKFNKIAIHVITNVSSAIF